MVKEIIQGTYNKTYKLLLIVPALMILFSVIYLVNFYNQTGDIIKRDVSLTGGTSVTVFDSKANIDDVRTALEKDFPDLAIRSISDIGTGKQKGFVLDTKGDDSDAIKSALESYLGYSLTSENSSIEFSGSTISEGFYRQLVNSIIAAFLLMAWVVFLIFGKSMSMKGISTIVTFLGVSIALNQVYSLKILAMLFVLAGIVVTFFDKKKSKKIGWLAYGAGILSIILLFAFPNENLLIPIYLGLIILYVTNSIPSFAVILSAFADILMTLAIVNMMGMTISGAGIIAFLMLIGYSVDTDILLTTRLLKNKEGSVNSRIFGAFKTGITMTLTSIAAVGVSLWIIYGLSETLKQIFTILLIGLFFDIFNTWLTNTSLLKWYMGAKNLE
jgi:preprotein translocase subunit SecF